jgi:hypothetical protein
MKGHISFAAVLLLAAFAPIEGRAALVFSDVFHSATTLARTELSPPVDDFDSEFIPNQGAGGVEALSRAIGEPFPDLPNLSLINCLRTPRTAPLGDGTQQSWLVTSGAAMAASQDPDGTFEHF